MCNATGAEAAAAASMDGLLQQLVAASDAVAGSPLPPTDEAAQEFLQAHPLDQIFRYAVAMQGGDWCMLLVCEVQIGITRNTFCSPRSVLSVAAIDKHAVDVISSALAKVLGTAYGASGGTGTKAVSRARSCRGLLLSQLRMTTLRRAQQA
jgi:hypothetical protein